MSLVEEPAYARRRVSWPWVVLCELAGALLITAAYLTEALWSWQGVSPSALVNLGTALGLAGVLFFLEKQFTRDVAEASTRAVVEATLSIEDRIRSRTDELAARLDELQAQLDERLKQRAAQQDSSVQSIASAVSYSTMTAAFTTANDIGAICGGCLTVPATREIVPPVTVTFSWQAQILDGNTISNPVFLIHANVPERPVGGRPVVEIEWLPEESAAEVGEKLVHKLQRTGEWKGPTTLDWSACVEGVQRGLDIAIKSRRREDGAWHLSGCLAETIGTDWFITEDALECPSRSYHLDASAFPHRFGKSGHALDVLKSSIPMPEWAGEDEWQYVIRKAFEHFPKYRLVGGVGGGSVTWLPFTSDLPR